MGAVLMMKISTKGRYALRIMVDLARHSAESPVSLREISERQNIIPKYMESIMALLLREKLVISIRGKAGGYRLARSPEQYRVYDILRAAEGDLEPVQCLVQKPNVCPLAPDCATLPLWEGLSRVVRQYLESYTLEALLGNGGAFSYCDGI